MPLDDSTIQSRHANALWLQLKVPQSGRGHQQTDLPKERSNQNMGIQHRSPGR